MCASHGTLLTLNDIFALRGLFSLGRLETSCLSRGSGPVGEAGPLLSGETDWWQMLNW